MASMRAARVTGPGQIAVVDLPVPEPRPGEVLVRVVTYAPYGTDVGVYLNRGGRYVSEYPVGIGADFSGVVHAIGEAVTNVAVGDRVCALALEHCGVCANCERGKTNLCLDPAFANVPRQSCCQQYTLVCARKLARLPQGISFEDGAMLAGIVDALNAYEKFGVAAGQHIAVIGVGAMGLSAVATAVALGCEVTAIGGTGKRADLALQLGARRAVRLSKHDEDVSKAALASMPGGFEFVIETTASTWGLQQAFAVTGMGGAVAVTGGSAQLCLTGWDVVQRELRILGIRAGHHQEQALSLIEAGRIDLKQTITARFALSRVSEAFELLSGERAADVGRVLIQVSDE